MEASERLVLAQEAERLGVTMDSVALDRLSAYADLLRTWNRRARLLGDRDAESLIRKHLPDCLAMVPLVSGRGPLADLGTGAGLPGLALACALPELECWLVESRRRKASFLHESRAHLGLDRVTVLEARAESLGLDPRFAGRARSVTARALAPETLLDAGTPLLGPGGRLLIMDSRRRPIDRLDSMGNQRGFRVAYVREYDLSTGEGRRIVALERG